MFDRAALRLTLQYTLILVVVIFIFSFSIYTYMGRTFGVEYVDAYQMGHADLTQPSDVREVADAGLGRLKNGLILFDGGVLVLIPFLSYAMALRALRPLRESYEQQEAFTDNASHELRTPLAVIQGELELALQRPRSTKEYKEAIELSLAQTRTLVALSNQLLLLARGDGSNVRNDFKQLNLAEVIKATLYGLNLSSEQIKRIGVSIPQEILVYGSPALLQQAIGNVLSNAVKFTSEDDGITITATHTGETVKLAIKDTGKGMTKQEVARAFDRFWRAERSRSTEGHGLGLPIVKQIVRLHDGKVEISSSTSGTIVYLYLPNRQK
jgi:signal transduction histidine kinase